jgi:hypothetical protein
MYRNFTVCPHCTAKGLPGRLRKIQENTPSITVSDGKSFHLVLLSGPGRAQGQFVGQFSYLHDGLGAEPHRVDLMLTRPGENFEEVTTQFEKAALKLAELLERGTGLSLKYGFDGEVLWERLSESAP